MFNTTHRIRAIVLSLTIILSVSAFAQEKQFNKASKKNTVESYEKFIKKYPNSNYTDEAEFNKAKIINTISSYEAYLAKYPRGYFVKSANMNLCKLEYNKIESSDDIEHFKQYLKKYNNCQYYGNEAREKLIELEFQKAQQLNTHESFQYFIENYPNNKFKSNAENKIQEFEFEIAKSENSIHAINDFIIKYPYSNLQEEAEGLLGKIEFDIAKKINTIDAYDNFLCNYPVGPYAEKAKTFKREIEVSDFYHAKEENTKEAYIAFNQKYPNGNYLYQSQQLMTRLEFDEIKSDLNGLKKFLDNHQGPEWKTKVQLAMEDLAVKKNFSQKVNKADIFTGVNVTPFDGPYWYSYYLSLKSDDDGPYFVIKTEYDKDRIPTGFFDATGSTAMVKLNKEFNFYHNTIWRFMQGSFSIGPYQIINDDESNPLVFVLKRHVGMVYLYGQGKVSKNAKVIRQFR